MNAQLRRFAGGFFFNVFLFGAVFLAFSEKHAVADEEPAFFLKIAKNIPRVGRSGRFDDFFFKSAKSIPRIGRRDGNDETNDELLQSAETWPKYKSQDPFVGPSKRRVDYPSNEDPTWTWQHFPLAIEGPRELWRTLAGYSTDSSDDIDNEVWQRKKRTESTSTDSR